MIDVRPIGYAQAARTVGGEVAGGAEYAADALHRALAACAGMAGSDDIGAGWGHAYDTAAAAAMAATTAAANASYGIAALLEQTGINYSGAEAASIPWETAAQSEARWSHATAPSTPVLPSAVGSGVPQPAGWSLLQHAIGRLWPDGHQDLLHAAAAAWRDAAVLVGATIPHLGDAIGEVLLQRTPECSDAAGVLLALRSQLAHLTRRYEQLATTCDDYAHRLDAAHSAILHECVEFVDVTIAAEAAGALLAVVTAGVSEVAANTAVAAVAVRIGRTIADLVDALAGFVVSIAAELDAAAAGFATVERELAPVLARRVEQAAVVRPGVVGQVVPAATRLDVDLNRLALVPVGRKRALPFVDDPKVFDPRAMESMRLEDARRAMPPEWEVEPSKSGGGEVFIDPRNRGRQIRLMPGYPRGTRPDLVTEGPYAVVAQNGKKTKIALAGNPTLR